MSLGRLAGPFSSLPFPNLQVSPIELVPKKHSTKFRTIFHLSFPKYGVTINYSISKRDHSVREFSLIRLDCILLALFPTVLNLVYTLRSWDDKYTISLITLLLKYSSITRLWF